MKLYDNGQSQRQTEPISSICLMSIKETGRLIIMGDWKEHSIFTGMRLHFNRIIFFFY
jgi:hypothetical protein